MQYSWLGEFCFVSCLSVKNYFKTLYNSFSVELPELLKLLSNILREVVFSSLIDYDFKQFFNIDSAVGFNDKFVPTVFSRHE